MKNHRVFHFLWYATDVLLIISLISVIYGAVWEYSTRSYLKGFSDAIVPASGSDETKVEAILAWMEHGPARRSEPPSSMLAARDPADTLNYQGLLSVCGTATNAFVNLADSGGLRARRLLLLGDNLQSKHVVAEVLIDGRWAVVDPSYRFIFRDAQGRTLTREQLKDPAVFREATQGIPGYPQEYTYERAVHVRLSRLPLPQRYFHIRRWLTSLWPNWEEAVNWTYVLERESFALLLSSFIVFCFASLIRLLLSWYGSRRLGIRRVRFRDQLHRVSATFFGQAQ
ncbi:MAG: hypothetical protein ACLP1Y_00360 [Candidatus Acidiferrales bacterium]